MKKFLLVILAMTMVTSMALADTTVRNNSDYVPIVNSEVDNLPGIAAYTPNLCLPFSQTLPYTTLSITSDGNSYYGINGGAGSQATVQTYDLAGNITNTVINNLGMRAIFHNPNDGLLYVKIYGLDLYTTDPVTGTNVLIHSGIFHDYNAKVAYDSSSNLIYEHSSGTVWVIDLATGTTINTMTGFITGGWGFQFAIAFNGCHLFTWVDGGLVHAYELDGTWVEQFVVPNGWGPKWGWTLSHAGGKLFTADDNSMWYGYCGVEGECSCDFCDVGMSNLGPDPVTSGQPFEIEGTIGNPSGSTITTDVWYGVMNGGVFYQQGLVPNITLLPHAYVGAIVRQQTPPGFPGTYDYCAYCGDYATQAVCDSFCFSFTMTWPLNGGSGGSTWADIQTQWKFDSDSDLEANVPSEITVSNAYPNPFNATTAISYDLPTAGKVSIEVYNLMGQRVATLVNSHMEAGQHSVVWDAGDYSSGMYFYKLTSGDNVITKRMTLLK